ENGSPSSNVTVQLFNAGGSTAIATTTTSASGVYRFAALSFGSYDVKPVAPTSRTVALSSGSPAATGQDFTLAPISAGFPPIPAGHHLGEAVPAEYIV